MNSKDNHEPTKILQNNNLPKKERRKDYATYTGTHRNKSNLKLLFIKLHLNIGHPRCVILEPGKVLNKTVVNTQIKTLTFNVHVY